MLFARILVSWFPGAKNSQVINILFLLTEPILAPIRSVLQRMQSGNVNGNRPMFDLSPLIAILLVQVVRSVVL